MIILGIETSCDETSAAVVTFSDEKNPHGIILSQETATSLTLHAATGGIIPEKAAREQLKYILPVIDTTLHKAFPDYQWNEKKLAPPIDAIAVTYGPGLIGSLLIGVETARTLSYIWNKPIIPVNHLYGHIYANWLIADSKWQMAEPYAIGHKPYTAIPFPAIALVVSGGHTDLVLLKNHGDLTVIGGTRDDAAGEAFDKIGRLLGLSYPAGHEISELAKKGDPKKIILPRPMIGSPDFDFSFSGLKTAVLNLVKKNKWHFEEEQFKKANMQLLYDLCAGVQEAIVTVLVRKTIKAAQKYEVKSILLGGGVAANDKLREDMKQSALSTLPNARLFVPTKHLSTDNGAMIAAAAYFNNTDTPWQDVTANPELYY